MECAGHHEVIHEDLATLEFYGYFRPQHVRDQPERAPARQGEVDVHLRGRVRAGKCVRDMHRAIDPLRIVWVAYGLSRCDFERDDIGRGHEANRREGIHYQAVKMLDIIERKFRGRTHLPYPSCSRLRGYNGTGRRPSRR